MTIVNLQKVHDFVYEEYPIFDIFLYGVDQLFLSSCQLHTLNAALQVDN
jgi:hypothetical protein